MKLERLALKTDDICGETTVSTDMFSFKDKLSDYSVDIPLNAKESQVRQSFEQQFCSLPVRADITPVNLKQRSFTIEQPSIRLRQSLDRIQSAKPRKPMMQLNDGSEYDNYNLKQRPFEER